MKVKRWKFNINKVWGFNTTSNVVDKCPGAPCVFIKGDSAPVTKDSIKFNVYFYYKDM